jgi:hypothetical protein
MHNNLQLSSTFFEAPKLQLPTCLKAALSSEGRGADVALGLSEAGGRVESCPAGGQDRTEDRTRSLASLVIGQRTGQDRTGVVYSSYTRS